MIIYQNIPNILLEHYLFIYEVLNMRLSRTLEVKQATSIIQYKLLESIGVTTVYQIIKYDNVHNSVTFIARNIVSYDAIMLIWSDVLRGIQK